MGQTWGRRVNHTAKHRKTISSGSWTENVWTNTYVICRERHNKVLMSLDPSIYNKITGDKASQIYEYKVEDDEIQYAEIET